MPLSVKSQKQAPNPVKPPDKTPQSEYKSQAKNDCSNCGMSHAKGNCPAKGTVCNYCKKPNHWIKVCRKRLGKNVKSVQDAYDSADSESDDPLHIYATNETNVNSIGKDKWKVCLEIEGKDVWCRIDTGAKCSILTKCEIDAMQHKTALKKSSRTLKSFSNHIIRPIGTASLNVTYKQNSRSSGHFAGKYSQR